MTITEYTAFEAATKALQDEIAKGTQTVLMKTYQRPEDLKWVWSVSSSLTPDPE